MPKSLFTSKHHKFIAEAIRESRELHNDFIVEDVLIAILTFSFRQDNPKFDAVSFRIACGEHPDHSD